MNLSFRLLTAVLFTFVLITSACSPSFPIPTTSPTIIASSTPLPTATQPPPTATSLPTETPTVPSPTATSLPTETPTAIPVFWDDFSGELLPGWTWIRENDALWSLTSEPGYLRIVLQGGRPPRNLLLRDVGSDNFQIMTHVLFNPTTNFQFAGLLVYQDEGTDAAFGRAYCDTRNICVGNGIYFDAIQSDNYLGNNFATDTKVKDEAYLRLDKNGSIFTGYYSEDGSNWILIGEHEIFMTEPKVGIITGNSYVVGMVALFDYFTVMEMP